MARIRELGLSPIAGLVHHGSGPRHTSLLDPMFGEKLAHYAELVARRFPWIEAWTPVNEPMVTARFSGLYGHWYPHHQQDRSFVRMVINQCRAIVLSMQAVRRINPASKYVHTDDGGTVYSTPPLAYQATFENHRRDLALDLLFGRVDSAHPLCDYLLNNGVTFAELEWFAAQDVTPDTIGIDYYATSDRYLDHRVALYPPATLGGNGVHRYADVAAAGNMPGWSAGFSEALQRTGVQYDRPVALTEIHLGCTREEQLRWMDAAWRGARAAASKGVAVKAVTSWALFGSFDWDQLATTNNGHYEPGAFDLRGPAPRRTAIGAAVESIARSGTFTHAVLEQPGWWERARHASPVASRRVRATNVLILGARGTLGAAFVRRCHDRGLAHLALSRAQVDIRDPMAVRRAVAASRPWAVINATGFVEVDAAELDQASCEQTNVFGATNVAEACMRTGAKLLTFSSDLVFDGSRNTPYDEQHAMRPLNAYGRSKQAAEERIRILTPSALIVRTSAFFGPWDEANFVTRALRELTQGRVVRAASNIVSPTYVPALVDACLDLLIDGEEGIWHLSNKGAMSWASLARLAASLVGTDTSLVHECEPVALGWIAARPRYSALSSSRGCLLPRVEESLEHYLAARPLPSRQRTR